MRRWPSGRMVRLLGYPRNAYPFDDHQEAAGLGDAYDRLLRAQIEYLNRRTVELLAAIASSDRDAVVVVFSDHGSGVGYSDLDPQLPSLDLRTANLLAVSAPKGNPMIDDRSTLINLLPSDPQTWCSGCHSTRRPKTSGSTRGSVRRP